MQSRRRIKKALIILGWLALWQAAAVLVHNPIYFAGPAECLKELGRQAGTAVFWQAIGSSWIRILTGFSGACLAAYVLAFAAYRFGLLEEILAPFAAFLRSVPVAAVVVVLLIWSGAEFLVFYISFMVVFPNIYGNMLSGLRSVDGKMLEMAKVFRMPAGRKWRCIYRPAYLPYLKTALSFSTGMSFKSGVAAEIIALPQSAIGTRLYMDKIYLNTAGVFAWTAVILLLGFITEKALNFLMGFGLFPRKTGMAAAEMPVIKKDLQAEEISKAFDGREVLKQISLEVKAGERCCIMGASGSGKSTLLGILAGLLPKDGGRHQPAAAGMCFQENRLWEDADARTNLWMAGCRGDYMEALRQILPRDRCNVPVRELSGGEKRRVAVARALLCPAEWILLDEPFNGLDEENRQKVIRWILKWQKERPLLAVTHEEADVRLLEAKLLRLQEGRLYGES
ncbi:MAG: ATP-binding cassette domain-containing protein [Lachnospiraceae bacterium]|nr:ATP-binding cassette domain-containing protein [Lachnospiraceae bacterium]